ncbi:protein translocase subunit SecF [uncultured Abyssibacter sp.]|uniref:protein translocase subunit SecF n=1 Tax=uncultured Abyssibacter sp. TaxID=2320202 RepID=UPI0032B12A2A
MKFFSQTPNFDFMAQRKIALSISVILIIASLFSLATRQLNFGIDFTGGVIVEVGYPEAADLDTIRGQLSDNGFNDAIVQYFGARNDVMIRLAPREEDSSADLSGEVLTALRADGAQPDLRRVEFVGPQVGEELTVDGSLATIIALLLIFAYVWFRFHWKFSAGAVAALAHDVVITLGFFSFLHLEFDLTVLAAVLAVIGYSLNDTIVVFDRCRENFRRAAAGDAKATINRSVNENLSRTLVTSLTTLLALIALRLIGGEVMAGFSTALIVGVVVGTYSSVYVASPVSIALGVSRDDVMPPTDDGDRPSDGAVV